MYVTHVERGIGFKDLGMFDLLLLCVVVFYVLGSEATG